MTDKQITLKTIEDDVTALRNAQAEILSEIRAVATVTLNSPRDKRHGLETIEELTDKALELVYGVRPSPTSKGDGA